MPLEKQTCRNISNICYWYKPWLNYKCLLMSWRQICSYISQMPIVRSFDFVWMVLNIVFKLNLSKPLATNILTPPDNHLLHLWFVYKYDTRLYNNKWSAASSLRYEFRWNHDCVIHNTQSHRRSAPATTKCYEENAN